MKPYFERDGIVIYHGDCRDVLPTLADGSVDIVLTSPPYNLREGGSSNLSGSSKRSAWKTPALAGGYGAHADDMPYADYVAWQKNVLRECWRLVSDQGAIYYQHMPRVIDGQVRLAKAAA